MDISRPDECEPRCKDHISLRPSLSLEKLSKVDRDDNVLEATEMKSQRIEIRSTTTQ